MNLALMLAQSVNAAANIVSALVKVSEFLLNVFRSDDKGFSE